MSGRGTRGSCDNFPRGRSRPFDVDSLEDRVRRSLARAAEEVTPRSEFAERAIRRGRRVRRRQAAVGLLTVVMATALAGGGAALVRGPWDGPPVLDTSVPDLSGPDLARPTPSPEPAVSSTPHTPTVPVDLVMDNSLLRANGGRIDLTGVGRVSESYATGGGWLIIAASPTSTGTESLWYAGPDGVPRHLLDADTGAVVVAPDGTRVAWRHSSGLFVADLDRGALVQPARVAPWTDAVPVGFAGDAVRLRSGTTEELWSPSPNTEGTRRPTEAVTVYGPLSDGRFVGQAIHATEGGEEHCLARFDAELRVDRTVCGLGLTPGGVGWVSPGGRWLLAEVSAEGGTRAALIDLTAVFAERSGQPRTVQIEGAPAGGAAWESEDTVVRSTRGTLERLRLDRLWEGQPGGIEVLPLGGGSQRRDVIVVTRWAL